MSPQTALVRAVVAGLRADAAVAALATSGTGTARVFDEPPSDEQTPASGRGVLASGATTAPYVYCGPMVATPEPRVPDCGETWTAKLRLYCAVFDHGREVLWNLAHVVAQALHFETLPLEGGWKLAGPLTVATTGDVIDPLSPKLVFLDVSATLIPS